MPLVFFALVLLGGCSAEQPPGRSEPHESRAADSTVVEKSVGQSVYESNCSGCHDSGVGGAPRPGDRSAWEPLTAAGTGVLFEKASQGYEGKKGTMPPRGGNPELSDGEIKNAITYMISKLNARASESTPDRREPIEKYQ
ncbi:MAG: cytochrome c5 family protein [Chlorobiaceae bacterium]|nr:cytochrome c5 family protein [Chlorobiaceae bacterium]